MSPIRRVSGLRRIFTPSGYEMASLAPGQVFKMRVAGTYKYYMINQSTGQMEETDPPTN